MQRNPQTHQKTLSASRALLFGVTWGWAIAYYEPSYL
jgi:hypothetical protein